MNIIEIIKAIFAPLAPLKDTNITTLVATALDEYTILTGALLAVADWIVTRTKNTVDDSVYAWIKGLFTRKSKPQKGGTDT